MHQGALVIAKTAVWAGILGGCMGVATAAIPTEQKAIVQTGNGGPEVLKLETVPVPDPGADQVLIKVYASGVNPVDWKMRQTRMGPPPGPPAGGGAAPAGDTALKRSIPGIDVSGVIVKVGAKVTSLKVGDKVFSMIGRGITTLNGGYSQYALAPEGNVVAKPKKYTFAQAAGMGTIGVTAQRSITQAKVSAGQRVLITGVAGGVGSSAAQIAKADGAYVIGTASARHDAYLKSIGVDEVIDYTQGNFEDKVKDVDVVIDTVGGDTAERAIKTLKKGGILVSVAARNLGPKCEAAGVTCPGGGPPGAGGGPSEGDMLRAVAHLADQGKFRVHVDKTFPLAKAADAQEFNRDGHTEGKVILAVMASEANKK